MICNSCLVELSGKPKFCPKCGARIEAPIESAQPTKRCPQCGAENQIGAKFCKKDGYRFEDAETRVSASAPMAGVIDSSPPAILTVEPVVTVAPPARYIPSEPRAIKPTGDAPSETPSPNTPDSAKAALTDLSDTAELTPAKASHRVTSRS